MSQITIAQPRECKQYSPEERNNIISAVFDHMANGHSLSGICEQLGVSDATVVGWLGSDPRLEIEYEQLKIIRSRVLVEHCIRDIEELDNPLDAKRVDIICRHRMRLAALLNPKEFSERMQASPNRAGTGPGRVSFTLNFGGAAPALGESVTVTVNENEE